MSSAPEDAAWVELPPARYDRVWQRFEAEFRFHPSVRPQDWPSFQEPRPSATWNISDLLASFNTWMDKRATPYNLALLSALLSWVAPDEPVYALDWQHATYEFYPHRFHEPHDPANWRIPALPSGEYHIFVTEDHRLGSLGHPWEGTVCVFGKGFLDLYEELTPLPGERLIRQRS